MKKKGLQKEEKFDIITDVAEKTASKQKASEKSLKKLKKRGWQKQEAAV